MGIALDSCSEVTKGRGEDNVVTEGDALSQNKLGFQMQNSLNQVCVIVWEFSVSYSMLFIWARYVYC